MRPRTIKVHLVGVRRNVQCCGDIGKRLLFLTKIPFPLSDEVGIGPSVYVIMRHLDPVQKSRSVNLNSLRGLWSMHKMVWH